MQWLALNWVWILFLGGMIAMHAFGGLIESFLYGAHAGLVYVPVYNFMQRRFAN